MTQTHSIIVRQDLEVSIRPNAYQLRDQALVACALLGEVTDEAGKDVWVKAQTALKELIDECERSRKAVKEPVLDLARKIDATAKEYRSKLDSEYLRGSLIVGNYEALQLAKLRAAEAANRKELNDKERERDLAIAQAKSLEEIDEIRERFAQDQAALQAQLPSIQRFDHQRVTEDWEVEVTNIHALYLAQPTCVKLEPRLFEIKALLKSGITPPGITAKKVTKSGVKL